MTLEMLLEAGFDFTGNKERAITKNEKVANVWLRPKDTADRITKIKTGENMGEKDKENYLTALHVMRKIASNKRLKQERRDKAAELLKNAGVDLASLKDEDRKLLDQAKENFNKKHAETNRGPEEDPREEPTTEPARPSAQPATSEPEPEDSEPDIQDEPETSDESEPEAEELTTTPKKASNTIASLRDSTKAKIQEVIDKMEKEGKREKVEEARKVLRKFEKRMSSLQGKALAGPRNAREALNFAKAEASNYLNKAHAVPLKGAIGRSVQGTGEALGRAKERAIKTIGRAKEAYKSSETLNKIGDVASKVKERIIPTVEKGVEKIGQKIEKAGINTDYNLIKKYVNAQAAEQFMADPNSDVAKNLLVQAQKTRDTQSKTLKQRISSVKKRVTPKSNEALSSLRSKLAATIGSKSPSSKRKAS